MSNAAETLRIVPNERRTGRPRRQDSYEKVSFTISTALLNALDHRAQEWGMNRSSAVAKIVKAQVAEVAADDKYQHMKETLKEIDALLKERKAS